MMNEYDEKVSKKTMLLAIVIVFSVVGIGGYIINVMWKAHIERVVERDCTKLIELIGKEGETIEEIIGEDGVYGTYELIYDDFKLMKCSPSTLIVSLFENREIAFNWTFVNSIAEISNTYDLIVEKITDILGDDKLIYTEEEDTVMWQYDSYNIISVRMEPYSAPGDTSNVVSEFQITISHQCMDIG